MLHQLAEAFGVDAEAVINMRRHADAFSCVGIAMMMMGKGRDYAAQQIRLVCDRYPHLSEQNHYETFPGPRARVALLTFCEADRCAAVCCAEVSC